MRAPLVLIVLLSAIVLGCACGPSHSAFLAQANTMIGKPIPLSWKHNNSDSPYFRGDKLLSNGNREIGWLYTWGYRYRKGECRRYYEYDPKTDIIVRWRFEGAESDCLSVC